MSPRGESLFAAVLGLAVAIPAAGQDAAMAPWLRDTLYLRLSAALDTVWAIDGHTHLTRFAPWHVDDPAGPLLGGRSLHDPYIRWALARRFGVDPDDDIAEVARQVEARRREEMEELGPTEYWYRHLDHTRTGVVLINENRVEGLDHERLRWVPSATTLLFPLPGEGFLRPGGTIANLERTRSDLDAFLDEVGYDSVPARLDGYLEAVDQMLRAWKGQGAVAVKFFDAYMRTLEFQDVPRSTAAPIFAAGRTRRLSRDEYIAVQDHIARHIFVTAGTLGMAVHIHSSSGQPPFLRLQDADVRHLESVLTDPRFFGTRFVLVHGGFPLTFDAIYLALKPNVWVDISGMGWYPPPDLAAILRTFLLTAPHRVLFGTDATVFPGVPGGAEVAHIARSRVTRESLYLALAGLVRDQVMDMERAILVGRGVLADNARRLYGW